MQTVDYLHEVRFVVGRDVTKTNEKVDDYWVIFSVR